MSQGFSYWRMGASPLTSQKFAHSLPTLTLFQMANKGQKGPSTSFSPVISTNVRIIPKNILTFIFNPFSLFV